MPNDRVKVPRFFINSIKKSFKDAFKWARKFQKTEYADKYFTSKPFIDSSKRIRINIKKKFSNPDASFRATWSDITDVPTARECVNYMKRRKVIKCKLTIFFSWSKKMQDEENRLMTVKGEEYTVSDEDKFKNFKSIGERMDLQAEKVCLIYLLKHMDSIRNYVLTGSEVSEEPITGRIQDARNYLLLLGGIIEEKRATKI